MPAKAQIVLAEKERMRVEKLLEDGTSSPAMRRRALVLSLLNKGLTDVRCGMMASMSHSGVKKIRVRFAEVGFEKTILGSPKGHRPRALSRETEARLHALATERTASGRKAWTLKTLRDHIADMEGVNLSLESIRRIIKRQAKQMAA
jgi:transposase